MSLRSIFFMSLLSLSIAAPIAAIGCAAPSSDDAEDAEVTQDELTSTAKQLVGTYWTHAPSFGGFAKLVLRANGTYTADVDPAGTALCAKSPCLLPESGTWNASKTAAGHRLRVTPSGGPARFYAATKNATDLVLSRAGQTQTLHVLGANACLDSSDCDANEECGPKFCLMYCAVDDPYCCGPSTCQPKSPPPPPPPPKCWGAWLDQNGLCRTPADGVYPDACCAGQTTPCGDSKCGVGTVCCNPLAGICTKPGQACAF
jgi:hypothetical protein